MKEEVTFTTAIPTDKPDKNVNMYNEEAFKLALEAFHNRTEVVLMVHDDWNPEDSPLIKRMNARIKDYDKFEGVKIFKSGLLEKGQEWLIPDFNFKFGMPWNSNREFVYKREKEDEWSYQYRWGMSMDMDYRMSTLYAMQPELYRNFKWYEKIGRYFKSIIKRVKVIEKQRLLSFGYY